MSVVPVECPDGGTVLRLWSLFRQEVIGLTSDLFIRVQIMLFCKYQETNHSEGFIILMPFHCLNGKTDVY